MKLLLTFVFFFCFAGASHVALADATPQADWSRADIKHKQGVLWKITTPDDADTAPSYLLGTMHTEDPRVLKLPEEIEQAFTHADSVSLELLLDFSNMMSAMDLMFLDDGQNLAVLIGKENFKIVFDAISRHGLMINSVMKLKPWAAMLLMSQPPSETGEFLDALLYSRAEAAGKALYGLETPVEQVSGLETLTMDEQVHMLEETIRQLDDFDEMMEKLHQIYLARDLAAMVALNDEYSNLEDDPIARKVIKLLLDDRNLRMMERMQPRLAEGNAFVAVGALHLPGKQGLLRLLEAEGYTVESIY